MTYVIFFFFFQAEDGIRDYKVTGVQTCALPILITSSAATPTFASAAFTHTACHKASLLPRVPSLSGPVTYPASRFRHPARDRKSTRLNSSHLVISYAVFCLKKKEINASSIK